jgi:hypothetical protein
MRERHPEAYQQVSCGEPSDKGYQPNCAIIMLATIEGASYFRDGAVLGSANRNGRANTSNLVNCHLYQKGETMKQIHWHDDLNSGLELARRDHKHVLLDFHNPL